MKFNRKMFEIIDSGENLDNGFEDILELSQKCKFSDCTHTTESDCEVKKAISQGILSEEEFKNYHRVKKEAEYVLEYDIEGLIIPGGNDVEVRPEIISLIQNLNESDHFPRHNFILDRVVRDGNIIT